MSELRERKKPAGGSATAVKASPPITKLGAVAELDDLKKQAAPRRQTPADPPRRLAPLILNAVFGLAIIGLVVLIVQSKLPKYPARYGICTFDESVYVDAYTSTECVVVAADGTIEYTGTKEATREKYGDLDTLGKLSRWNLRLPGLHAGSTGLKIYTVPRGQAVFPGQSV